MVTQRDTPPMPRADREGQHQQADVDEVDRPRERAQTSGSRRGGRDDEHHQRRGQPHQAAREQRARLRAGASPLFVNAISRPMTTSARA